MAFFLAAGLLVRSAPLSAGKAPPAAANAQPAVSQAEKPDQEKNPEAEPPEASQPADAPPPSEESREAQEEWVLYVTGAVRSPGVYTLPPGTRIFQLVQASGGLDPAADAAAVNMAAVLEDGQHVHIPAKGEEAPAAPLAAPRPAPRGASGGAAPVEAKRVLVDINRATAEELTALKGIGPVLAENIIEFRRLNGRFHNVDDLLQVKGIGAKKLEGLRGSVTAGP